MTIGSAPTLSWMENQPQPQQPSPADVSLSQMTPDQLQQLVFLYQQQSILQQDASPGANSHGSPPAWNIKHSP